ncbi:hypothetical protein RIR_jg8818.t1 [Rhizophagus irregularis DAOM 181602=DAOM 197198]|nr:hypothetical protein RIR_jg8818.t1 [Rhizophagus irregularis DAOM 181602=DAOM 197198]
MGNNKNKSKSKTLSSYIPIQEFVDNFTTSGCGSCTWNVQVGTAATAAEKGKVTIQSQAYMSKDTNINLLIDESMNADGDEDLNFTTSQSNQKGDLNDQQISLSISKPIGTSIPAE